MELQSDGSVRGQADSGQQLKRSPACNHRIFDYYRMLGLPLSCKQKYQMGTTRNVATWPHTGLAASAQHQAFHAHSAASLILALDHDAAQPDISIGRFEARRHPAEKSFNH